jgi:periplasmic divalent cation tolerance protein
MDDGAILVLCTAPAKGDVGERLARGLVEARLAACVNLVGGVRSVYRWQGELQQDDELQLLIKTRRSLWPELQRFVTEHHPYEVPELLVVPIEAGSERYLAWLFEQTVS